MHACMHACMHVCVYIYISLSLSIYIYIIRIYALRDFHLPIRLSFQLSPLLKHLTTSFIVIRSSSSSGSSSSSSSSSNSISITIIIITIHRSSCVALAEKQNHEAGLRPPVRQVLRPVQTNGRREACCVITYHRYHC